MILYADDDIDDRTWVGEACKTINKALQVHFVETGRQVLDYLNKKLGPLPGLIVLDLNMPEIDGRQTLQLLKANESYQHIPVVIVTTSINKIDQEVCKRLGAALFLTKPDTHKEWQNIVKQLEVFIF
jgi:CheY-like chemotaxis protein